MKLVYALNDKGDYIGEHICQKCPLTEDYIYPAFYTSKKPPEVEEFKKPVFNFSTARWAVKDIYFGKKLYHKTTKEQLVIDDENKTPADYPDYTDLPIPDTTLTIYYDYSEDTDTWEFDLTRYKKDICRHVSALCVNENYKMLPQYKRDNIYAGSPASDGYPVYLQGDTGKQSIAKLNAIYQQIATSKHAEINAEDIVSIDEINRIIEDIIFPTEEEVILKIQS